MKLAVELYRRQEANGIVIVGLLLLMREERAQTLLRNRHEGRQFPFVSVEHVETDKRLEELLHQRRLLDAGCDLRLHQEIDHSK